MNAVRTLSILALSLLTAGAVWADDGDQCQLPGDGVDGAPLRYAVRNDGTIADLNT